VRGLQCCNKLEERPGGVRDTDGVTFCGVRDTGRVIFCGVSDTAQFKKNDKICFCGVSVTGGVTFCGVRDTGRVIFCGVSDTGGVLSAVSRTPVG
jgi:hypothetical protein